MATAKSYAFPEKDTLTGFKALAEQGIGTFGEWLNVWQGDESRQSSAKLISSQASNLKALIDAGIQPNTLFTHLTSQTSDEIQQFFLQPGDDNLMRFRNYADATAWVKDLLQQHMPELDILKKLTSSYASFLITLPATVPQTQYGASSSTVAFTEQLSNAWNATLQEKKDSTTLSVAVLLGESQIYSPDDGTPITFPPELQLKIADQIGLATHQVNNVSKATASSQGPSF